MTAQTVNLSSITYNDSSGLDKLTIKGASTLENRDTDNFPLFNVRSHDNSGFNMHRHLLMNNWDIGGGRNIVVAKDIGAGNDIGAQNPLKKVSIWR